MSTLQIGSNVFIKGTHGTGINNAYGSIEGVVSAEGIIPTGSVIYTATNFGGTATLPIGYLRCDGSVLSKSDYPELWDAIGSTFNSGVVGGFPGAGVNLPGTLNIATQFRIPYLSGSFIRCWDGPIRTSIDPGTTQRIFGSYQGDDFKSHNHTVPISGGGTATTILTSTTGASGTLFTSTTPAAVSEGLETRPRNIALMAIIKY